LRADGAATFYFIQHRWQNEARDWTTSNIESFLFQGLSYEEKRGEKGDHYRNLLDKQSASTDLWQKYGVHGFVELEDAIALFEALKAEAPEHQGKKHRFRIAKRTICQHTEVLVGGRYS
jgi:hypothetical protein